MKRLALVLLSALLLSPIVASAQSATLSYDGILNIKGTNRPETIKIVVKYTRFGRMLQYDIKDDLNRTTRGSFYASQVDVIGVFGYDGNDTIINNSDIPSWQWGGKGDDKLYGGSGDDQLSGEEGRDDLFGGPGDDCLIAGPFSTRPTFLDGGPGLDEFRYNFHDIVDDGQYDDDRVDLFGSPNGWPSLLAAPDYIRRDGTMVIDEAGAN